MAAKGNDAARLAALAALLRRKIDSALTTLRARTLTSNAVHDARKDLQRARAGLRLLRPAIGERAYARENAMLRDATRPLARVRDAKVMSDTYDQLVTREKKARRHARRGTVQKRLREERVRRQIGLQGSGTLKAVERALESAGKDIAGWKMRGDGDAVVLAGLERIYRRGRKALAQLDAGNSTEKLHESRKQLKYLGHALEMLERGRARPVRKTIRRAAAVAGRLGDDHDLAVLAQKLAALSRNAQPADPAVLSRIGQRREKLQRKALKQARRVYRKKPKAFVKRLGT